MTHKTSEIAASSASTSLPGDPLPPEKEQKLIDLWASQARDRSAWWDGYLRNQAKGREAIATTKLRSA